MVEVWSEGGTLEVGYSLNTRNMASSAAMVLPEPVGAPSRTLVSEWYSVWKICVWMGLKWVNLYRLSYRRFPSAVTGNGCRSSNSAQRTTSHSGPGSGCVCLCVGWVCTCVCGVCVCTCVSVLLY